MDAYTFFVDQMTELFSGINFGSYADIGLLVIAFAIAQRLCQDYVLYYLMNKRLFRQASHAELPSERRKPHVSLVLLWGLIYITTLFAGAFIVSVETLPTLLITLTLLLIIYIAVISFALSPARAKLDELLYRDISKKTN